MKKLLLAALVVATAVSLTACGSEDESAQVLTTPSTPTSTSAPTGDVLFAQKLEGLGFRTEGQLHLYKPLATGTCETLDTAANNAAGNSAALLDSSTDLLFSTGKVSSKEEAQAFYKAAIEVYCPQHMGLVSTTHSAAPGSAIAATPAASSPDSIFLNVLAASNVPNVGDEHMIGLGKSACALLDEGKSSMAIGGTIGRESEGMFTMNDAATIIGAAVGAFCAEHGDTFN